MKTFRFFSPLRSLFVGTPARRLLVERHHFISRGFSLIELLVVMGLLTIFLPALVGGLSSARSGKVQQSQRLSAMGLLKESEEAVRLVRNYLNGWDKIISADCANPNYCHPVIDIGSAQWLLNAGQETIFLDGSTFVRSITIRDVLRDASGNISSVGTLDPSTKRIDSEVSWTLPQPSKVNSTIYLTRLYNLAYSETTTADFTPGLKIGTAINSSIGDGAVVLKQDLSSHDWCQPNITDIPPYPVGGNGIGIAISSVVGSLGQPNTAYISTGENAASASLFSLGITNPLSPAKPVPSTTHTYNHFKDYGVYGNNSYVFVATDHPGLAVDIIDKSTFLSVGYYDSSSKPAYSVSVSGNTGYVTVASKFEAFDVSTIKGTSSQTKLWSVNLLGSAKGNKIIVIGNYAYVSTTATSNSRQLQIIDLTTHNISTVPSSGVGAINTTKPGVDVAVLNNYAFLITGYTSESVPDIFAIDISNPASPQVIGTANTNYQNLPMDPLGIATTPSNKIIVVGNGGYQYQVFEVDTPSNPTWCGPQLKDPNGAQKVTAVSTLTEADGDVYSYSLTTDGSTQQFQIIAGGGGGGGGYLATGTFESKPFELANSTAFNSFEAMVNQNLPSINTTIKVTVVNKVNGNCTDPDYSLAYKDPVIYQNDNSHLNGTIPIGNFGSYTNPGHCFRYKLILNGDGVNLNPPSLEKITINYSP